jgi:amidase
MVAGAHASDGGGSIRIPASACGLVGLKPSRGRNSFGPALGERWGGLSCEGFITRSVRDSAALLDVVAGPMPGDPYFTPLPPAPFASFVRPGPRRRIGLMTSGPRDTPVHVECAMAARRAAKALEDLGHEVTSSYPEALNEPAGVTAYVGVIAVSTARALDTWAEKLGRPIREDDVEPLTWALSETARSRTATEYLASIETVHAFSRRVATWWEKGFDLLLTPTTAEPPPRLGQFPSTKEDPFQGFLRAAPFGAFTLNFNLTGQPAISLPVHWTPDGLPLGAHLVAPYGREDMLFEVSAELEQALPWRDRHPPLPFGPP